MKEFGQNSERNFLKMFNESTNKNVDTDNLINFFVKNGALEITGVDEKTGELLYKITHKMEDFDKGLYDAHLNAIYGDTMFLWQEGFIGIEDLTEEDPTAYLLPKAFDKQARDLLSSEMLDKLDQIIGALSE